MPSPFRMKAVRLAQLEIQFTRASNVVPLPEGAIIEFGIKAKDKTDTDALVYCNTFSATAGGFYAATVNMASVTLEAALGIGDGNTANDKRSPVEFAGEVGWSIDGENVFSSQTFPVFVETPVLSGGSPTLYNPVHYPVLDGNVLHFVRGDGTLGTASGGGGLTTLTTYTGNIGTSEAPAGNIYGTFIGDGNGLTNLNPNAFNASNWNGCSIGTNDAPMDTITAWHVIGRGDGSFVGDGSGLTNVAASSITTASGFYIVEQDGQLYSNVMVGHIGTEGNSIGDVYASRLYGDGSGLTGIAPDLANYTGNIGWSYAPMGDVYATDFYGDGSGLTGVGGGSSDLSSYAGDIGGDGTPAGNIYGTFHGDGSSMVCGYAYTSGGAAVAQVGFNDFFSSITNYNSMDVGGSGSINSLTANYFYGDGSGLTNVGGGGGTDVSSWGDPQVSGFGPVFGNTSGTYFDEYGIAAVARVAQTAENAGSAANAGSNFNDFFWNYGGQNIGTVGTPVDNFYGTIGDSDNWCANAFITNIEGGKITADQYFTCYTGMALPDPAQTGSICYSRHAGGHFYGLTDDGWKQLDNA